MTAYESAISAAHHNPNILGAEPVSLRVVNNSLCGVDGTPLITMLGPPLSGDLTYAPYAASFSAVTRESSDIAFTPDCQIRISPRGTVTFADRQTGAQLFILPPGPTENGGTGSRKEPDKRHKLAPGRNVVVLAPAASDIDRPLGAYIVLQSALAVKGEIGLGHPEASRAIGDCILRTQTTTDAVLVAIFDIAERSRYGTAMSYARKAGALVAAIALAKAVKENPDVLPFIAATGVLGVGTAIVRVITSPLVRNLSSTKEQAITTQQPSPPRRIPHQRPRRPATPVNTERVSA